MPYKSGSWGEQAQKRNEKRLKYFAQHNLNKYYGIIKKRTDLGYLGEEEILKLLQGSSRYSNEIDLIWNGKLIDVKTATLTNQNKCSRWIFTINSQKGKCDYFIFICKNTRKETKYIFMIPDYEISNRVTFSITKTKVNKFSKYALKVR